MVEQKKKGYKNKIQNEDRLKKEANDEQQNEQNKERTNDLKNEFKWKKKETERFGSLNLNEQKKE